MTTDDRSSQHATALDTNENSQLATSLEAVEVRLEFPLQSDAELATIRHRKAAEERRRHRTPRRINSLEQCEAALRDIHEDLNALELWSIHLRRWTKQLGLCVEVANQNRPDSPPTSQNIKGFFEEESQRLLRERHSWEQSKELSEQDYRQVEQGYRRVLSCLVRKKLREVLRLVHLLGVIFILAVFSGNFAKTSYFPDVNCGVSRLLKVYDIEEDSCYTSISRFHHLWGFAPWVPGPLILILL
jgi:hypothetical protein